MWRRVEVALVMRRDLHALRGQRAARRRVRSMLLRYRNIHDIIVQVDRGGRFQGVSGVETADRKLRIRVETVDGHGVVWYG